MNADQQILYRQFKIIARFYKEKHQGRAYYKGPFEKFFDKIKFSKEGADIESVINLLKNDIDLWFISNKQKLDEFRTELHKKFLLNQNIEYLGVRQAPKSRHRVATCYNCQNQLDNSIDLECIACEWILCDCGACGCGWQKRNFF